MIFVLLPISTLFYIILYLPIYNSKFIEIKSLSSGKYLVLFDNKISIYNNNFIENKTLETFSNLIRGTDNIIINKHIYNQDIFIFILIKNYLYIYDDKRENFFSFNVANSVKSNYLKYKYYNLLPYNTNNNKLNIVINFN